MANDEELICTSQSNVDNLWQQPLTFTWEWLINWLRTISRSFKMDCCEIWDFIGNPMSGPHYWYSSTLDSSCRMGFSHAEARDESFSSWKLLAVVMLWKWRWRLSSQTAMKHRISILYKALVQEIWSQSFPCMEKGWKEYFCGHLSDSNEELERTIRIWLKNQNCGGLFCRF